MSSPVLIKESIGSAAPEISVVIPLFNQSAIIGRVLNSVLDNLTLPAQIIVIDDKSNDGSSTQVKKWIGNQKDSVHTFQLFRANHSLYETACDVFGIEKSTCENVIEIQADMLIEDPGFDQRLLDALTSSSDLFLISGRGTGLWSDASNEYKASLGASIAHGNSIRVFAFNQFRGWVGKKIRRNSLKNSQKEVDLNLDLALPTAEHFIKTGISGVVGAEIAILPDFKADDLRKLYKSETVMRGPIIISKTKYFEVGGFDGESFFLGFDDHDLTFRAWCKKGYRCAYMPIRFHSPTDAGSTRKSRSLVQIIELTLELFRVRNARKASYLYNYDDHVSVYGLPSRTLGEF